MAEAIEGFRKEFKALKDTATEGAEAILKHDDFAGKTRAFFRTGLTNFAEIAAELKEKGHKGAKPDDFLDDKDAKAAHKVLVDTADSYSKRTFALDRELTKAKATVPKLAKLKSEIEAEIKDRKKKVTTKLGIGNKSVPDMEKLLKEVTDFGDSSSFESISDHTSGGEADLKDELRDELPKLVAKSGSQLKTDKELDQFMALLEVRKLGGALNRARKLHDGVVEAGKALSSKGFDKAIVADIAKSAAELKQLADIYDKALKSSKVQFALKTSKYKSQIESSVSAMVDMRTAVLAEVGKARTLTANAKG